jgi:hypothetical protein
MTYAILTANAITATGTAEDVWAGVSHPSS